MYNNVYLLLIWNYAGFFRGLNLLSCCLCGVARSCPQQRMQPAACTSYSDSRAHWICAPWNLCNGISFLLNIECVFAFSWPERYSYVNMKFERSDMLRVSGCERSELCFNIHEVNIYEESWWCMYGFVYMNVWLYEWVDGSVYAFECMCVEISVCRICFYANM